MRQCMDMDNLHNRLKRVDGQIKAIDRMIEQDVPCEDILFRLMLPRLPYIKLARLC